MTKSTVCRGFIDEEPPAEIAGDSVRESGLASGASARSDELAAPFSRLVRRSSGVSARLEARVILFISADEEALSAYDALARASRFESELARDGYEAILLAYLARPDAVVLDVRDARVEGGTVLERFERGFYTRALPMVIVGVAPGDVLRRRPRDGRHLYALQTSEALDVLRAVERILDEAARSEPAPP